MDNRDVQKLMKYINPEDEELRSQLVRMLQELLGVAVSKEMDLAIIAKEMMELPEPHRTQLRDLLARYRERTTMGGKHQLSGFALGPGPAEGGPQPLEIIGKEERRDVTNLVLRELSKGEAIVHISENVTLQEAPLFYRVTLKECHSGPEGFTRDPAGTWSAEVRRTPDVVESIAAAIAVAVRALAYERRGTRSAQHPFSTWEFTGASQDIPMVHVAGPGGF